MLKNKFVYRISISQVSQKIDPWSDLVAQWLGSATRYFYQIVAETIVHAIWRRKPKTLQGAPRDQILIDAESIVYEVGSDSIRFLNPSWHTVTTNNKRHTTHNTPPTTQNPQERPWTDRPTYHNPPILQTIFLKPWPGGMRVSDIPKSKNADPMAPKWSIWVDLGRLLGRHFPSIFATS